MDSLAVLNAFKEPPKQDAPTTVLWQRMVFVSIFTLATFVGSVTYFSLQETEITELTSDVSESCPLVITPQALVFLHESGSSLTAQISDSFTVSSEAACQALLDVTATTRLGFSNQFESGSFQCGQNTKPGAPVIGCFMSELTYYRQAPVFSVQVRYKELEFSVAEFCPNFPNDDCLNVKVLKRNATTTCLEWKGGINRCFSRNTAMTFIAEAGCKTLFERLTPHLCTTVLRNTPVTILSLTINNTSSVFAIALSLAFFLFSDKSDQPPSAAAVSPSSVTPKVDAGHSDADRRVARMSRATGRPATPSAASSRGGLPSPSQGQEQTVLAVYDNDVTSPTSPSRHRKSAKKSKSKRPQTVAEHAAAAAMETTPPRTSPRAEQPSTDAHVDMGDM